MNNDCTLVASNISHTFGDLQALDNISFSLERETFTCLVGPSGCGKSTLLRVLSGLLLPEEGSVCLNGKFLTEPDPKASLVFQDATLMPWRTVRQNLMLPLEINHSTTYNKDHLADDLLEMLGLSEFGNLYPSALSGGMAQRLAIGRALIHDPELLLLDEPFGALDALTREHVGEELLRIWAHDRKTVFMVTHSIQEAVFLADRILVMTPRPGHISHDFEIDLPRPRNLQMVTNSAFVALEEKVRLALRPQL